VYNGVQKPHHGGTVRHQNQQPFEAHVMERLTVKIEEAAAILGISRNGAYAAAKRGEIPTIKIGGRILVPRLALDRMLDAKARPAQ
jgi:excisionase family DNA binding protein